MSELQVIVDTREQWPWTFPDMPVVCLRQKLDAGDYCAVDAPEFCIERKSPEDFIQTISWGRERFERELERLRGTGGGAVVVEGTLDGVTYGCGNQRPDGSLRVHPNAVLGTVAVLWQRYRIPVYFGGNRLGAQRLSFYLMRHAVEEKAEG